MTKHYVRNRGRAVTAPLILASLLLTACGGGSESGDSAAAGGGDDCGNTLKYGILTAFTGELGDFGEVSQNSFELAMKQMEESGALPEGWTVDTVVADEESDIEVGLRAATNMMQNENVSVILGPSSGPIVAMDSISQRYETPVVSQFAGTTNFDQVGGEWLFRTVASDASDGLAVAQWLEEQGHQNVAIVVQNDQSTITAGRAAGSRFEDAGGTVVETIEYEAGQPSYQAVVEQTLNLDADAIYLAGGQQSATTILNQMRQAGADSSTIVVSADLVVPDVISTIGADWAEGMAGVTPKGDQERAEYGEFAEAYQAEYGEAPGLFAENAYDAAMLVGLAAVAAESTCGSAIGPKLQEVSAAPGTEVSSFAEGAEALAAGDDIDYVGASGTVDFDETGTVPGSYAVMTVQGGEWTQAQFFPAETFTD
ncbi:MAG: ABC transporter substrate-binding protein [Actinomycetota bacterium]|nr:ABC transporter substrate-binding protein [Actinomycetota bacterium]